MIRRASTSYKIKVSLVSHTLGFLLGSVISYLMSVATATWIAVSIYSMLGGFALEYFIVGFVSMLFIAMIVISQSKLSIVTGFGLSLIFYLVVSVAVSFRNAGPLPYGLTSPSSFEFFLSHAGRNPGTIGILSACVALWFVNIKKRKIEQDRVPGNQKEALKV